MSAPESEGLIWHTDPRTYQMAIAEPTFNVNACLSAMIVDGNANPFTVTPSVDQLPKLMDADYFDVSKPLWLLESFDGFPTEQSNGFTLFAILSAHYQQHQVADHVVFTNTYPL